VLQEHRVKRRVVKRQMQGLTNLQRDAIGQSAACRQVSGRCR
jgi:hypothetical protein